LAFNISETQVVKDVALSTPDVEAGSPEVYLGANKFDQALAPLFSKELEIRKGAHPVPKFGNTLRAPLIGVLAIMHTAFLAFISDRTRSVRFRLDCY
jgi:hypothetical protein